jgi:hypothetical protein
VVAKRAHFVAYAKAAFTGSQWLRPARSDAASVCTVDQPISPFAFTGAARAPGEAGELSVGAGGGLAVLSLLARRWERGRQTGRWWVV